MFVPLIASLNRKVHDNVARLRIPLAIGVLFVIVYFVGLNAYGVPYRSVYVDWQPDGTATVVQALQIAPISGPAQITDVQVGDQLVSIDGIPFRRSDLHFRFGPVSDFHTYEFRRGDAAYIVRIESGQPTIAEQFGLLLPGLVALEAWLLGFLVILFAPVDDNAAWLVGLVTWGMALALTGATAMESGVPGSRFAYTVLLPIMAVGYVEMAFVPGSSTGNPGSSRPIRALYISAAALSALAVIEAFVLLPDISLTTITGVPLLTVMVIVLGLVLLAVPAIMAIRAMRLPSNYAYARRQISILLAGTGLALLPLVFLTLVPELVGVAGLPWGMTVPLLGMVPATYGYVIYRHRYLNLDFFVSRSVTLLLAAFVVSALYTVGMAVVRGLPSIASIELIFGMAILLVGFGIVGVIGEPLRRTVDLFLYGPNRYFDRVLRDLTGELSIDPQIQTLRNILLRIVPDLLEVRRAALLLLDRDGMLAPIDHVRADAAALQSPEVLNRASDIIVRHIAQNAAIFEAYPWANLAIPLMVRTKPTGVWLLGDKVPSGHFDAQEVAFLQQLAASAAITAESARLFEALQQISQDLLRVRAAERMQISARLHDEPLQRAGAIARTLERALASMPVEGELAVLLDRQLAEVFHLGRELRDICAGLRPPILDQGLRLTLRHVVNAFRDQASELRVSLAIPEGPEPVLSSEALDAVYHVVTESLNNVQRYAHATKVQISWQYLPNLVEVSVVDDGNGTRLVGLSLSELARGRHFGIVGMHQWAAVAGGQLIMKSVEPHGTSVYLTLPINGPPNGRDIAMVESWMVVDDTRG